MSLINVKSSTPLAGLFVMFYGSVANEDASNYGISHLMEHLLAKNVDELHSDFTRDGIDENAATDKRFIYFYITGLEKYLIPYRQAYLDKLLQFNITEEILEKEKQIVIQEYTTYFAKQTMSHYLNLLRKKYNYFWSLGSEECIKRITLNDCKKYYNLQFKKPHQIINISSENNFINKLSLDFQQKHNDITLKETHQQVKLELNNKFDKTSSVIAYKIVENNIKELRFIATVLSKGLESPLYQALREKTGLVYSVACWADAINDYQCFICVCSDMIDDNVEPFKNILFETLKQDIDPQRFETVKQAFKVDLEKSEIWNYKDISPYIFPKQYLDLEFIENLDYNHINKIYKNTFADLVVSVDKQKFGNG